jgi:3-oxoacyl-ACP reductase-like protein
MLILSSAAPSTLDNVLTIALVSVLALIVIAVVIRKAIANKNAVETPAPVQPVAPLEAPKAPGTAGQLKLHDVEPKTAAMLMAIVADKLQKPINELRFISIKEVQ